MIEVQYGLTKVPVDRVFEIKMHWLNVRVRLQCERAMKGLRKKHSILNDGYFK